MSDEMFWNRNGTMREMSNAANMISGSHMNGASRFGNIIGMIRSLLSFLG